MKDGAYRKVLSKWRVVALFPGAYYTVVFLPNLYLTPFFLVSELTEVESAGVAVFSHSRGLSHRGDHHGERTKRGAVGQADKAYPPLYRG
jgi:hypothetical protein